LTETGLKIAVFIDFDNIEIGVKTTLNQPFDIAAILDGIKERGEGVFCLERDRSGVLRVFVGPNLQRPIGAALDREHSGGLVERQTLAFRSSMLPTSVPFTDAHRFSGAAQRGPLSRRRNSDRPSVELEADRPLCGRLAAR
jgi:hypothetical protein